MISRLAGLLGQIRGDTTKARALRGTGFTIFNIVGRNGLRLISNIILTRLLFPEAFGLMSLIQVFIYGLQTFSDIGIQAMLIQHKDGTDRRFLDTLWTLQILRGVALWLVACLLALPLSWIYDQPEVVVLFPVVAFSLVIEGFKTTKEAQANRELMLGRIVGLDLACQVAGLVAMAILAYLLKSVWALVFGVLIGAFLRVIVFQYGLPGAKNRLCWEPAIVRHAISFGKFIFLSTICTFILNASPRMILGAYVEIAVFGIFSIAWMLGRSSKMIADAVAQKVIFPLYRIKPPQESAENRRKLFLARRMVGLMALGLSSTLVFLGIWLVDVLYDPRYALAGPMVALFAVSMIPQNALLGTQEVLLGVGDSKRHFYLMSAQAVTQLVLSFSGVIILGVVGAILAPALTALLTYPLRVWLISRYDAWDPKGELGLMTLGFAIAGVACWLQWESLATLW